MSCNFSWCLNPVISDGLCEPHKEIEALVKGQSYQFSEIKRLRAVLEKIAEGTGRYSRDQLENAGNTIEYMRELATKALAGDLT